jgi:regulator of replication initiation timing
MILEALDAEVQKYIDRQKAEAQSVIEELAGKHKATVEENTLLKLQCLELKERYGLLPFKRFGRATEQLPRGKKQPLLFDERQGAQESGEGASEHTGTHEIE